jgi:probable phosphoglycerate mutase
MATVLLVRHGETNWNREGRIQGWAPSRLTDRGHEQADSLADHVAATYTVDRVVASDLLRVQETADHLARTLGVDVALDPAWRERDFGFLQGLTDDELHEQLPEYSLQAVGHSAAEARPKGGESFLDVRERVLAAWADLLHTLDDDETVLVVTHGGPIRFVLADLKGLDAVAAVLDQEQNNCALNEIRVASPPELVRENETTFLTQSRSG